MNVSENSETAATRNVLPLFSSVELPDPMTEILLEGRADDHLEAEAAPRLKRSIVSENLFPDQSMYVLDQQVSNLRESLSRLKFYLSDLDDLLPR